jgi:hypothetical protein
VPLQVADHHGYTVCYETDMIDVPSFRDGTLRYVPDPSWAHIDARGHLHSHGLDSWDVEMQSVWCHDCREAHDELLRYVCSIPGCNETIRPAYVQDGRHPQHPQVPGMRRMYVLRPDGSRVDLTGDEARTLEEVGAEWLPEFLDALPEGRWSGPTSFR